MTTRTLGVVVDGVTGRRGIRPYLLRSIRAVHERSGVGQGLGGGGRVLLRPVLAGRSCAELRTLAAAHGIANGSRIANGIANGIANATASLDEVLAEPPPRSTETPGRVASTSPRPASASRGRAAVSNWSRLMITREHRVLRRPGRRFLLLPARGGALEPYELKGPYDWPRTTTPPVSRVAYAAAHVVADPFADPSPASLDWETTLAYRRHLWSFGLRVAEAMDTAQRGTGLDWTAARELIRRSAAEAKAYGDPYDLLACGAGTDHVPQAASLDEIGAAYEEQVAVVEEAGARVVLMAGRQIAGVARGPEDHHELYARVLGQVSRPVILHWLGEMFDPEPAGSGGAPDRDAATDLLLDLVHAHAAMIDGVKVSLRDAAHETRLRAALPEGVRLYTGDDLAYPSLIKDGSDALLGVFDAIAPAASAALVALDDDRPADYDAIFARTVPLARKLFEAPTQAYKTGLVFLSWLAGYQDAFVMVGGAQSARSVLHLSEVFRLADLAGLLPDPDLATRRMRSYLTTAGVL